MKRVYVSIENKLSVVSTDMQGSIDDVTVSEILMKNPDSK